MSFLRNGLAAGLLWLVVLPVSAQTVLIVGDSISAAFGLEIDQGWVNLLEQRLQARDQAIEVVNASVSGDTTAGGLARLPRLLEQYSPALVVIELGGNDGLRGLSPTNVQQNLSSMVALAKGEGAQVMLLGIKIPPNYGRRYTQAFEQAFVEASEEQDIPLIPFILDGIAGEPDESLMQQDGIHPTAEAQPRILDNVWPLFEQWLVETQQASN
ncbi:MAG: arylesterase [Gammaproteobacteria bacterium HGW-Gammaproteobacteria-6]|nr:MAG: arylesterase [Gammaproteobacteria bacterium HGW-Gammaproteobacteria-6]